MPEGQQDQTPPTPTSSPDARIGRYHQLRERVKAKIPDAKSLAEKSGLGEAVSNNDLPSQVRKEIQTKINRLAINIAGEQVREEEKSDIDSLTGVYNRNGFNKRLQEEVVRSSRYNHVTSIAVIDANGLKKVNDTLGHEEGDKMLQKIAEVLRKGVRLQDIIARFGGDEFAIILPETDIEHAEEAKVRINELLLANDLKVSIGVEEINLQDVAGSIKKADEKMYAEKRAYKKMQRGNVFTRVKQQVQNLLSKFKKSK